VDDDQLDTIITIRCLDQLGIDNPIVHRTNGEDALEYLESEACERPCAILLDLNMPRMGGLEFLRHVKSRSSLRDIPVLILTTSTVREDMDMSRTLGAVEYIIKADDLIEFKRNLECIWPYTTNSPPATCTDQRGLAEGG
jgi:CheY-like chemotaxis protein